MTIYLSRLEMDYGKMEVVGILQKVFTYCIIYCRQVLLPAYYTAESFYYTAEQCYGSGSGRIRNYLQDPDP